MTRAEHVYETFAAIVGPYMNRPTATAEGFGHHARIMLEKLSSVERVDVGTAKRADHTLVQLHVLLTSGETIEMGARV